MDDRIVDGFVDGVGHHGLFELGGTDSELVRRERYPIELGKRITHRSVAAHANVLEDDTDRCAQCRVEDVAETTVHQGGPSTAAHLVPHLSTHHAHRRKITVEPFDWRCGYAFWMCAVGLIGPGTGWVR